MQFSIFAQPCSSSFKKFTNKNAIYRNSQKTQLKNPIQSTLAIKPQQTHGSTPNHTTNAETSQLNQFKPKTRPFFLSSSKPCRKENAKKQLSMGEDESRRKNLTKHGNARLHIPFGCMRDFRSSSANSKIRASELKRTYEIGYDD
jgi:hypothetical protein